MDLQNALDVVFSINLFECCILCYRKQTEYVDENDIRL